MFDDRDKNNESFLTNIDNLKNKQISPLSIDTEYVENSRSNSIDSGKGNDFSNMSQFNSGKDSILSGVSDRRTSVSSSRSTPIDPGYHNSNYLYAKKRTSLDVIDSGISSPMSLTVDNLEYIKKQRRASSKFESEYDRMELLSGNHNSKLQIRVPKPLLGFQNNVGIVNIVSRIRSMSIGVSSSSTYSSRRPSDESYSISPTSLTPDQDLDSSRISKDNISNSLNYINKNNRGNRKWIRMTHSLSCEAQSLNPNNSKTPKGKYRSSYEAVNVPRDSPDMNRLERFLSGHIDTSTPNGALLAVINQGLRKVSESDRYLLFSKSPLRSPVDFLESGIEHLGDSDILITVLHHSTCYDLMPESGKLIVIDSILPINKAFTAIDDNNVDSAPIWNNDDQSFMGVLSKEHQMYLLLLAYQYREKSTDVDAYMAKISRESLSNCIAREPTRHQLQWVNPENTICSVIKRLEMTSSTQVLVIDEQRSGNALFLLDHRRILAFLLSLSQFGLPLPSVLKTMVGVTELMMNRKTLEHYKVYLDTDLATLLKVMDGNLHHCAIVCIDKPSCKSCLCTDECVGLLNVDDISLLISQSSHCDPSYKVESILNQTAHFQKSIVYCEEREPVMNVIKSIIQEKAPFILINQDCCKNCIHSIVSSKELLNYIMKHDKYSASRDNPFLHEKKKSMRSYSCCEENQKITDMNLSRISVTEKDEDIFEFKDLRN